MKPGQLMAARFRSHALLEGGCALDGAEHRDLNAMRFRRVSISQRSSRPLPAARTLLAASRMRRWLVESRPTVALV